MQNAHSSRKLLSVPLCLCLTLLCVQALATEPEPPIDIWDDQVGKGHVLLIINPSQVQEVTIQQLLLQDGKVLAQEKIDFRKFKVARAPQRLGVYKPDTDKRKQQKPPTKRPELKLEFTDKASKELFAILEQKEVKLDPKQPEVAQRFAVAIPLLSMQEKKMPEGYYAAKFVAEAKWRKGGVSPVHVEQWVYLKTAKAKATPVSLETYSRSVDPVSKEMDVNGRPVGVHIGKDSPEEQDIKDTKSTMAVPLGRLGGEPLEQQEPRTKPVDKKTVDESNEQ